MSILRFYRTATTQAFVVEARRLPGIVAAKPPNLIVGPVFQIFPAAPRILIFRGGAIGDFILTLPVFQALRRAWPRAEVTLAGHSRVAGLAEIAGLVQPVLSIDAARFAAYYTDRPLPPEEADFLRSFDLVISFLHDPDGALRRNWERAGARRVISVSPQVAAGHAADHFLSAVTSLGIMPSLWRGVPIPVPTIREVGRDCARDRDRKKSLAKLGSASKTPRWPLAFPRLDLPSALQAAGRAKLEALGLRGPVIALHPGSGSRRKNWPLPSFLALAEKIRQTGTGQVLWLAGEADAAIVRSLEQEFLPRREAGNPPRIPPGRGTEIQLPSLTKRRFPERSEFNGDAPILNNCPLPEVAAVLSQCRGCVGNDCGITHLAAAVGIPTVALFGPTDPEVWGPRGRQVAILRARPPTSRGLARLPVEDVERQLKALL